MIARYFMFFAAGTGRIGLAILLLTCCAATSWGQTKPSESQVIEFQRVYVPENRSQEWPRSGFEFAPQMKLADFEQLVTEYTQQQDRHDQKIPAEKIVYRATLEGRRLEGTADFVLGDSAQQEPRFVSLAGSNGFGDRGKGLPVHQVALKMDFPRQSLDHTHTHRVFRDRKAVPHNL